MTKLKIKGEEIGCGMAIMIIICVIIIAAISVLWTGFLVMVLVGVLHSWNASIPLISYKLSIVIGIVIGIVLTALITNLRVTTRD